MARPLNDDGPSVDSILQSLQKRPNVIATLILSRKDGSIIRASGADLGAKSNPTAATTTYENSADQSSDVAIQGDSDISSPSSGPTRVQLLASCIFNHVASAAALGEALQSSKVQDELATRKNKDHHDEYLAKNHQDDDVQLIRVRLRKAEVIIFPDPNYLCCVIQDMEKAGR